MMKTAALIVSVALLAGCDPKSSSPSVDGESPDKSYGVSDVAGFTGEVTIFDVEAKVRFRGQLPEQNLRTGVEQTLMENRMGELSMATITVSEPFPSELRLRFALEVSKNFKGTPLALQGRVIADKREVGTFQTVLGAEARDSNEEWHFDVLKGLDSIPETMLVLVEGTGILMPLGTDETTLDPATATGPASRTATVTGNPVRIDFVRRPSSE